MTWHNVTDCPLASLVHISSDLFWSSTGDLFTVSFALKTSWPSCKSLIGAMTFSSAAVHNTETICLRNLRQWSLVLQNQHGVPCVLPAQRSSYTLAAAPPRPRPRPPSSPFLRFVSCFSPGSAPSCQINDPCCDRRGNDSAKVRHGRCEVEKSRSQETKIKLE